MADFDALTPRGKARRIRGIAQQALSLYGLEDADLRLLKYTWNTIYRVDAEEGRRYVLRISRPGVRDLLDIESELTWMDALARETDIVVPAPVRTIRGGLVSEVEIPGVPESRYISLFEWVGGRHVVRSPSNRVIEMLGEMLARLQDHAENFVPPRDFTRRRFDRLGSFVAESQIHAENPHPLLRGKRLELFRREADRVQAELNRLYSGLTPPRFLHLDLHLNNVKLLNGRLAVLDFDDSMWAYPVQDIGISLYYLQYLRGFSGDVRVHFQRGYCRVREWPEEWEGQVNLMIEARALDLVDVVLTLDHPRIQATLPQRIQAVEDQIRELSGDS